MKILYISALFWPHFGGIETLALKFLPAMQERGHEFVIVTSLTNLAARGYEEYKGIPLYRFPFLKAISDRNLGLILKCIQEMANVKNTFKPDLVHVQMSASISYYHLKTLHSCPAPTLLTLHTCFGEFNADNNTVLGQTLQAADWTTAVSKAVMNAAKKVYPEISRYSSVVYNGIDCPGYILEPLDFSYPCIAGIGRLIQKKGFDILIDAFALLHPQIPQARLILVGDGTERKDLEQQVSSLNLQDVVKFTGQVHPQQVPELINLANVVVIPSRTDDSLPTVALEAGLLGRPVVAARKGGLEEIIVDGETGLLIETDDPQNYKDAILEIYTHPQKAISMGRSAHFRMKDIFGWNRYIDTYDYLYRNVGFKG
jgi:glycosyltransferase involved in cell wall biosynthesis